MIYSPNRFSIKRTSTADPARTHVAHSVLPTLPNIVGDSLNPDPYEMGNWVSGHFYNPPELVVVCGITRKWSVAATLNGGGVAYSLSEETDTGSTWKKAFRVGGDQASGGDQQDDGSGFAAPTIDFSYDIGGNESYFDPENSLWFPSVDISATVDVQSDGVSRPKRTSYRCRAIEAGSLGSIALSSDVLLTIGVHTLQMYKQTPEGYEEENITGSITITPMLPLIEV